MSSGEYARLYRQKHREHLNAYNRVYYHSHPKRIRSEEQKIKIRERARIRELNKHRALTLEQQLLKGAKSRASRRNLDFDLILADIKVPLICPILHILLKQQQKTHGPESPTLDRIDNSKGYIKDNIAVISHKANSHKADMTLEQVERLYKYMKKETQTNVD